MYQKVVIVGNLGGDPELRYTPQGDPVCSFSVATNRRWTGRDGQPGEETTWFRVTAWGKQAETCNQYLTKGRLVLIEGQLTPDKETGGPRTWMTNGGDTRASYELRIKEIQFLGDGRHYDNGQQEASQPKRESLNKALDWEPIAEDEIPF